jgi:RNA polymerase sigma-70 factor (ECF subfamily)
VYGFLAYRVGNRNDAEDLTQQTFERALKAAHRYDERKASVRTWLLTIAHNLLIDHYRLASTSREVVTDEIDPSVSSGEDRPDLGLSPDLELALNELGAREREVIALRFGGDLQGKEIAELLDLTLANVQQILSRALRKLRTQLDEPVA